MIIFGPKISNITQISRKRKYIRKKENTFQKNKVKKGNIGTRMVLLVSRYIENFF